MGIILNRRRVYGSDDNVPAYLKGYTLIHYWEADDWTVGTDDWVDRVGGLVFKKQGNPIKQDGLIGCMNKYVACFHLFPDSNADAPNGINMGSLWVVEVECMVYNTGRDQYVVDFGSVAPAHHSFCPFMVTSAGRMNFNEKFVGNDFGPEYRNDFYFTPYYGKLVKATIGTKEIDSDTVLPFYVLEGEIHDSPKTLTKAQALFNRNFDTAQIYVGLAVGNSDYAYVKSIKIYTKYQ